MDRYTGFARIYDKVMAAVDYEAWASYVERILSRAGLSFSSVLDLACGTGNTSFPFAARGYRVYGVDLSPEMLQVAAEKAARLGLDVHFLEQDMREVRLPERVDLAICLYDSMNYMLTTEDLLEVFTSVFRALNRGGAFVFDMNSSYQIRTVRPGITFFEDDDVALVWEDRVSPDGRLWEVELTVFERTETGLYRRFKETHIERGYDLHEVLELAARAGFTNLAQYEAFTMHPPCEQSRRIYFLCQRP